MGKVLRYLLRAASGRKNSWQKRKPSQGWSHCCWICRSKVLMSSKWLGHSCHGTEEHKWLLAFLRLQSLTLSGCHIFHIKIIWLFRSGQGISWKITSLLKKSCQEIYKQLKNNFPSKALLYHAEKLLSLSGRKNNNSKRPDFIQLGILTQTMQTRTGKTNSPFLP